MVATSVPRIRRVKLKGGAELSILPVSRHNQTQKKMLSDARQIASELGDDIAAYFVVAWSADGFYQIGSRIDMNKSAIGPTSAPSFVADIIRREVLGPTIVGENMIYD